MMLQQKVLIIAIFACFAASVQGGRLLSSLKKRTASALLVSSFGLFGNSAAFAQIPSYDDFTTQSGTKIRAAPQVIATDSVLDFSLPNLATELDRLEASTKAQLWEEVLREAKTSPALKAVSKKLFGGQGTGTIATSSPKEEAAVEELRESLDFTLGQLYDVALSKRVVFFNKEDLKSLDYLNVEDGGGGQEGEGEGGANKASNSNTKKQSLSSTSLDIEEPLALLKEAKDTLKQLVEAVK